MNEQELEEYRKKGETLFKKGKYKSALPYYLELAKEGDALSIYRLAICIDKGEKSRKKAMEWYELAADKGNVDAQYKVASFHYFPVFKEFQDHEKAVKYFRMAAEQGNGQACNNMGICYARGEGVEKDLEKAVEWFRKGAELGAGDAQTNFGICLLEGDGVNQNQVEAVSWLKKAAEQENVKGLYYLAYCHENGYGVDQNIDEAIKYYRLASEQGSERAEKALDRLLKKS